MSHRFDRGPTDAYLDASLPRGTPGKRAPTDRLQRKVPAAPSSASAAPARAYVDPMLGEGTFIDQLLAMPVQRRADGAPGADVHRLAAAGIAGPGGALPFAETIQASFGHHDVRGIVAHTDPAAGAAAAAMGATAFATGDHVAFAGAPDLHTAAHEAAHVVQQRAGVHLKGGVGEVGDAYERHADAVADAVVRGDSAAELLSAGPGGGAAGAVQRKAQPQAPTLDEQMEAAPGGDGKGATVPTTWYADFRGAGTHGAHTDAPGRAGGRLTPAHGDRTIGDALVVEGLHVGPLDQRGAHFAHQGNALPYGAAKIGTYDHPVGEGVVQGLVQYVAPSDIKAKVDWAVPPGKDDAAKVNAAVTAVGAFLKQHLRAQDANQGSFDALRAGAAEAADRALPGHGATVTLTFDRASQRFTLGPQTYQVDRPSNVSANITVPTTTHYTPWSVTTGEKRREYEHTRVVGGKRVEVERKEKDEKTTQRDVTVDTSRDQTTETKDHDRSKKSVDVSVSREKVSTFARDMTESVHHVASQGWAFLMDRWQQQTTAGVSTTPEVEAKPASEEESKSWLGRMWDGAAKFIGKYVVDNVKKAVKGVLKSKIAKWVGRGAKATELWFIPIGWGIDWLAGKVKGKLWGDKSEDKPAPVPNADTGTPADYISWGKKLQYDHESRLLHKYVKDMQDKITETKETTKETVNRAFQSHWEHEQDHSKTDLLAQHLKVHVDAKESHTTGGSTGVKVTTVDGVDATQGKDETTEKSVTYGGTAVEVKAGHPVLEVHVMPT